MGPRESLGGPVPSLEASPGLNTAGFSQGGGVETFCDRNKFLFNLWPLELL